MPATPPTPEQLRAVAALGNAIVDAVRGAGPLGAPGGVIYAALMGQGCTLERYEQFMAALVRVGRLTKRGECYFVAGANR
jgi:hypothetical protein